MSKIPKFSRAEALLMAKAIFDEIVRLEIYKEREEFFSLGNKDEKINDKIRNADEKIKSYNLILDKLESYQ